MYALPTILNYTIITQVSVLIFKVHMEWYFWSNGKLQPAFTFCCVFVVVCFWGGTLCEWWLLCVDDGFFVWMMASLCGWGCCWRRPQAQTIWSVYQTEIDVLWCTARVVYCFCIICFFLCFRIVCTCHAPSHSDKLFWNYCKLTSICYDILWTKCLLAVAIFESDVFVRPLNVK